MRIGFVTDSITEKIVGVGRYARNVAGALSRQGHHIIPIDWRSDVSACVHECSKLSPSVVVRNKWPFAKTLLWHFSLLHNLKGRDGAFDVVVNPSQFLHPIGRLVVPFVYVVHDVSFFTHPACHKRGKKTLFRLFFKQTLQKADHIVCVSEHTKRTLLQYVSIDEEKISVVFPGVEEHFKPTTDATMLRRIREQFNLPERFLLYVGTIEPRKNLETVFHAYSAFREGLDLPLYIGGSIGWRTKKILKLYNQLGLDKKIKFLGYIPDKDLPALYSLATAFIYPSKEEGFGLPVIEAMRCGTPVLISSAAALREVAGDAALMAPADDVYAIGQALMRISRDSTLQAHLKKMGLERCQSFTWHATATQLTNIFKKLAPQTENHRG